MRALRFPIFLFAVFFLCAGLVSAHNQAGILPGDDQGLGFCPFCYSGDVSSMGLHLWTCNTCLKVWSQWPPMKGAVEQRPVTDPDPDWCPQCGCQDTIKVGGMHSCLKCGHFWKDWDPPIVSVPAAVSKSARPVIEPDYFSCPKCHSPEINKSGNVYLCYSCYYMWNKWGIPMYSASDERDATACELLATETMKLQEAISRCYHQFSLIKIYSGSIGASQANPEKAAEEFESLKRNLSAATALFNRLDSLIMQLIFTYKDIDFTGVGKSMHKATGYFNECLKYAKIAKPDYMDQNFFHADTNIYLADKEIRGNFNAELGYLIEELKNAE
ncbi:MAG: hypothetical protein PHQ23_04795 [Candidatus Wallbacteria bacterium]|nr:hypothetical protein [Candidatus Wallbacteria bacterium]